MCDEEAEEPAEFHKRKYIPEMLTSFVALQTAVVDTLQSCEYNVCIQKQIAQAVHLYAATIERNHKPKRFTVRERHHELMIGLFFKLKKLCRRTRLEGFHDKIPLIKALGNPAQNTRYIDKCHRLHLDSAIRYHDEYVWSVKHLKPDIEEMLRLRRKLIDFDGVYLFLHLDKGRRVENQNTLHKHYTKYKLNHL